MIRQPFSNLLVDPRFVQQGHVMQPAQPHRGDIAGQFRRSGAVERDQPIAQEMTEGMIRIFSQIGTDET